MWTDLSLKGVISLGFVRDVEPGDSNYQVEVDTIHVTSTKLEALLTNVKNGVKFKLEIGGQVDNTFRLKINEAFPLKPRFEVPLVLVSEPDAAAINVISRDDEKITLGLGDASKAVLAFKPLRVDFYSGENLVLSTNHLNKWVVWLAHLCGVGLYFESLFISQCSSTCSLF